MDQKNYKKLANFVMKLPQYLYDEYRENINGVFLFFDEFQIIKELEDELTDFLWHMRSFIQKQNNVSYIFSGRQYQLTVFKKDEIWKNTMDEKECYNCKHMEFDISLCTQYYCRFHEKLVKIDDRCDDWSQSSN